MDRSGATPQNRNRGRPISADMPNPAIEPVAPVLVPEEMVEEAEVLQASIKAGTVAQIVVAAIAVIGLIYLLKFVLVTAMVSVLLAYVFEPPVKWLARFRISRGFGALIVVLSALALFGALAFYSCDSAIQFTDQLPAYTVRIRNTIGDIRFRVDRVADQARSIVESPKNEPRAVPVKIEQVPGIAGLISRNGETILDLSVTMGFVPFLVYFMLALKDHTHMATVRLFPKEHRLLAHRTIGTISAMVRTYIVANVLIGLLNSLLCTLIFWFLGIKYFYFIGALSGFIGLVPYLGVFASLLPPLAAGLDSLNRTGVFVLIIALVGIHVVTMNVLYPKFVGKRLQLNPLGVSLSLLFWVWIWGPIGLILAMPILGATKIVCDYVEPLRGVGQWLGESLR
ncbi:MAG: AI-2E family transporter [Terriglobales bacterium]